MLREVRFLPLRKCKKYNIPKTVFFFLPVRSCFVFSLSTHLFISVYLFTTFCIYYFVSSPHLYPFALIDPSFFQAHSFSPHFLIMATTRLSKSKVGVIEQVVSIIKSYNPTTHSIDTHCLEILGDVTKPVSLLSLSF